MAEFTHTIDVGTETLGNLKRYLDGNPEYLLFTSPSGMTLKVDIKQQKDEKDSAENIVVRWMKEIRNKTCNYTSAATSLNEIKAYCDAVIVAVTSK